MNSSTIAFLVLPLLPLAANAADATLPVERADIPVGSTFTYQRVDDPGTAKQQVNGEQVVTITGESANGYAATIKQPPGYSSAPPESLSLDLSWKRTVDGQPADTRWLSFPLEAGKSWSSAGKDLWVSPQGYHGNDDITYKVVGVEDVTVPAGTFKAVRVHGQGWWNITQGPKVSGQAVIDIWYSPDVRNIVRVEYTHVRTFNTGRWAFELTAYKLSKDAAAAGK